MRPGYVLARVSELLLGARGVDLGDRHREFGQYRATLGRDLGEAAGDGHALRDDAALVVPDTAKADGRDEGGMPEQDDQTPRPAPTHPHYPPRRSLTTPSTP